MRKENKKIRSCNVNVDGGCGGRRQSEEGVEARGKSNAGAGGRQRGVHEGWELPTLINELCDLPFFFFESNVGPFNVLYV